MPQKPKVDKRERRRIRRQAYRERRELADQLSKLTTNPNGDSQQEPVAVPTTQSPGTSTPPTAKRGKESPGESSKSKRPRQGDGGHSQQSFAAATKSTIFIRVVPLDSNGNEIRATEADRLFIVQSIEEYIAKRGPNINIIEFSLLGGSLRLRCQNQNTLECVKGWSVPLKVQGVTSKAIYAWAQVTDLLLKPLEFGWRILSQRNTSCLRS